MFVGFCVCFWTFCHHGYHSIDLVSDFGIIMMMEIRLDECKDGPGIWICCHSYLFFSDVDIKMCVSD